MMTEPAMTREEWADWNRTSPLYYGTLFEEALSPYSDYVLPDSRHALAALALHGQPFGFTRQDVEALRKAGSVGDEQFVYDNYARYDSLADRIEALLPPGE